MVQEMKILYKMQLIVKQKWQQNTIFFIFIF